MCANRIYVQSSVYADFASRLAEKVAAFKVGNGLEQGTYVKIEYGMIVQLLICILTAGHMGL